MASDWERRGLLPKGLSLGQVELTGDRVLVHAFARSTAAACPQCGRLSRQVHSRYRRGLTDLPAHGREVKILLAVRRFRCRTSRCQTAIFAEVFLRRYQPSCTANLPITGSGAPAGSHVGRKAGAGVGRTAVAAGEQGYVPSERACRFPPRAGTAARDRDRRLGLATRSAVWNPDLRSGTAADRRPSSRPRTCHGRGLAGPPPRDRDRGPRPRWRLRPRRFPGSSECSAGRGPVASARQLWEGLSGRGASFDARHPNGKAVAGMAPNCGAVFAQRGSGEACASPASGRHDSGARKRLPTPSRADARRRAGLPA